MKNDNKSDIAQRVKEHIERYDRLIELFDMEIEEAGPGVAKVSMKVGAMHLNAAGLCHGAALFALADVAFALAANCHGRMALAIEASMNYFRPVKEGSKVTASCQAVFQGRRTGSYTAMLYGPDGKEVALFKATAFRIDDKSVAK